jgi:hypothetical protein
LLSYPIGVSEEPPVVEQEQNSTGRNPAVIKKAIDDDFTLASFASSNTLARHAGRLLLASRVSYPLLEIAGRARVVWGAD